MKIKKIMIVFTVVPVLSTVTFASDFEKLDEALLLEIDIQSIAPVFDFDGDSCLPATGLSRNGVMNGGQKPSGSLTGACRSTNFLDLSNTFHRYSCETSEGNQYCGHFYSLYFEKDQIFSGIESGHRHDWEYAAVWTINGTVTHGSYSAHGDLKTVVASDLEFENGHLKIVYHKDGVGTHALRFAKENESAENPYGEFVTPTIVSWNTIIGDNIPNGSIRALLDKFDYGSANLPVHDSRFLNEMNEFKPSNYPTFTYSGEVVEYTQFINQASNLCLDIYNVEMADATNVIQWDCSGNDWQQWYFDQNTGLIHSKENPKYCLDNGGRFINGANVMIWSCNDSDNQKFISQSDESIGMALESNQVLDGYGIAEGDDVGTWWNWGGINQKWTHQ